MRSKLSIIFFILFFSISLFGQNPYIIVDTTKSWNSLQIGLGSWLVHLCGGTTTTRFGEEYIQNDVSYRKLLECKDTLQTDWDWNGLIREDTINSKVYLLSFWKGEGLLYDFGIEVGDTVTIHNNYDYLEFTANLVCDSIDTILINGIPKKRFYFYADYSDRTFYNEIWIEGIGSLFGVMNSGYGGSTYTGAYPTLLCCSKNDTILYEDEGFDTCYIDKFYPDILSEYYDTAFVNQPYDFQLHIDTLGVDSFAVIAEVIPEDFYFDSVTKILYGNPDSAGAFTCIFTVDNYDYNFDYGFKTDILYEDIIVLLKTGNEDILSKPKFKIYPNPIKENFTILTPGFSETNLEIYAIHGVKLLERKLKGEQHIIHADNLPVGLCFLVFKDPSGKIICTEKVMKVH